MKFSWTKVRGADDYDVILGKGINGDFGLYKSVDASVSKIQLTGLDEGEIYKVCVKAWKREKGEESFKHRWLSLMKDCRCVQGRSAASPGEHQVEWYH